MTEISEAFFAGAMHDTAKTLDATLAGGGSALMEYYKKIMGLINPKKKNASPIVFTNDAKRQEYVTAMTLSSKSLNGALANSKDTAILNNLIQGMTAASQFRKSIQSDKNWASYRKSSGINFETAGCTTYMTGSVWPDDIGIFKEEIDNWRDYNSTDVMITFDKRLFFGVSLKKKPNPNSISPTLINKSFEEAINGPQFTGLLDDLKASKRSYFTNLVIKAVTNGIIDPTDVAKGLKPAKGKSHLCKDMADFKAFVKSKAGKDEMFQSKYIDKSLFFKPGASTSTAKYINVKGSANHPKGYWDLSKSEMQQKGTMRKFVNEQLGDRTSGLFSEYINIMNRYSTIFGELLLSLVLKTKLEDAIVNKIKKEPKSSIVNKYKFSFWLVTGFGTINKQGSIANASADAKSLSTILCGISKIKEENLGGQYQVVMTKKILQKGGDTEGAESEAAKVYMTLKNGDMDILDLELRFKGEFMSSPQFQATMTKSFETLLKDRCAKK